MKMERNRWEIIKVMLKGAKEEEANSIQIMQKVCLDSGDFQKYFDFLLEEGFISINNSENSCYKLTKNGRNLLKGLEEVCEILPQNSKILIPCIIK